MQPPAPSPAFLRARVHLLLLFLLLGYGLMCLLSCALVCYLRLYRRHAFRGDQTAARKIILPAFEPLLLVLATATGCYAVYFAISIARDAYALGVSKLMTEVFYSGRQFVFLSVVVFMLQTSVSLSALRRSLLLTLVLSTYTIPIVALLSHFKARSELTYGILTASRALLLLLYVYVLLRPPDRTSKRAMREFCLYAFVYYALLFGYNALFQRGDLDWGFILTYTNLVWGSLCPLVIWRVLQADTEHWRSLGQRAVALQQSLQQHSRGSDSDETLMSKGLHVLVELHRKYIVDFAYLQLKRRLASGANSVVFHGVLRSQMDVAVKVYTPHELSEDVIAQFSQEAALSSALHHPNVVRFVGLCVRPPTICLLSELCVGSLKDVTEQNAAQHRPGRRQQLLVNVAYMLDAARAVAYLHSFTPAFLHRDIKPENFLVDTNNTVKITDFGESRSLPADLTHSRPRPRPRVLAKTLAGHPSESTRTSCDSFYSQHTTLSVSPPTRCMTIKGTVDYMAPELLQGHAGMACYGEAADIYSLAITFWDVLFPGEEKYPGTGGHHLKVVEQVLSGTRPPLGSVASHEEEDEDEDSDRDDSRLHPMLRALLESAWHADPRLRPSAAHVVSILECLQEELCQDFAWQLACNLHAHKLLLHDDHSDKDLATGDHIAAMMRVNQYVDGEGEATRVGNALMDAGIVHHADHARGFEGSEAQWYYFDEKMMGRESSAEDEASSQQWERPPNASGVSSRSSSSSRFDSSALMALLPPPFTSAGVPTDAPVTSNDELSFHHQRRPRHRSGRIPSDPTELLSGTGNCACKRLSQRLQLPPKSRSRQRGTRDTPSRSRHKMKKSSCPDLKLQLLSPGDYENCEATAYTNREDESPV